VKGHLHRGPPLLTKLPLPLPTHLKKGVPRQEQVQGFKEYRNIRVWGRHSGGYRLGFLRLLLGTITSQDGRIGTPAHCLQRRGVDIRE